VLGNLWIAKPGQYFLLVWGLQALKEDGSWRLEVRPRSNRGVTTRHQEEERTEILIVQNLKLLPGEGVVKSRIRKEEGLQIKKEKRF